jgi:AdoMet-dependent heme synthase
MAAKNTLIEQKIRDLINKTSGGRITGETLREELTLSQAGISVMELYELIVGLEDSYEITVDENDVNLTATTIGQLVQCVRKKIAQRAKKSINWKDTFESLVFSGQTPNLRTPIGVHLDPTFRCNARCIFCYDSSGSDHGLDEITLDEVKRVLDECRELDVVEITFGGGEPFLRDDFLAMVHYAKKLNLRSMILSNGMSITGEVARELVRCIDRRFDRIQVSLDGPNAEIHDRQRGVPGAFERTMAGIRNLQAVGIAPFINMVVTQHNYRCIPDMISFLMENRLDNIRVLRLHPLGRGRDMAFYRQWVLTPGQSEEAFEFLSSKREELAGEFHIASDNACIFPMSARKIREAVPPLPGRLPQSYACGAGTSKICIAPDGGVYPCSYMYEFPELRVGSIRTSTIRDLWERDELWTIYRQPIAPSGKCCDCEYLYSCKTGCRILSYSAFGDMGAPDPGCTYEPAACKNRNAACK